MKINKNTYEANPLVHLYLQEVFTLSLEVVNLYNEINDMLPDNTNTSDKGGLMIVKPEVFTKLTSIVVHSGNIKKILVSSPKKNKESREIYQYRKVREQIIHQVLPIDDIKEMLNVKTRNSIEHYDERLDKVALKIENKSLSNHYQMVTSNIIFSNGNIISGDVYYMKCYTMDTQIFSNDGDEVNIGKLFQEASLLLQRIKEALGNEDPRGGMMIRT